MPYDAMVNLDELAPYVLSRLQELQYGQKGQLAKRLSIGPAQLSHFIAGTKPIPQKYIPGILEFFGERVNLQIIDIKTGEVLNVPIRQS